MAIVTHDISRQHLEQKRHDLFDQLFDNWSGIFRPVILWAGRPYDNIRVEEFNENGTLVVRAELPGIDPEKDLEITVLGDLLSIDAHRHEEAATEVRNYVCREHRYGEYHREFTLPQGTAKADIKASYKDGILEIRVPVAEPDGEAAKKIPVTTTR
ncbi:MAG: Hsp20/alpha crystallin family protein [Acidimicrobiales bacterium]|jgi:HSP20 family protein